MPRSRRDGREALVPNPRKIARNIFISRFKLRHWPMAGRAPREVEETGIEKLDDPPVTL